MHLSIYPCDIPPFEIPSSRNTAFAYTTVAVHAVRVLSLQCISLRDILHVPRCMFAVPDLNPIHLGIGRCEEESDRRFGSERDM